MAFCTNCGHQLADDAKFCFECGAKVDPMSTVQAEQRKMIYDGETHKCPGCGELLNSFISVCPSCGYELRGTKATSALVDFNLKLENANDEKEKMTIIRNYPIPNTKEALFEFMVLASANFDASYHAAHLHEDDISDAWLSKAEQCYQKSKLTFGNSEDLPKIKDMYDKIITNRDLYTQLELQRKEKEQSEKRKKDKVAKRKKLALGQNIAGAMNTAMNGMNPGAVPPPVPVVAYHVAINGQAAGPYDLAALKQMAMSGQFNAASLVWKAGMTEWAKAETVDELKDVLSNVMPPIPPVV